MTAALAAFMFSACTETETDKPENGLQLDLEISEMNETKAAGVDALNENKIEAIDVFMFRSGEETAAVYRHIDAEGLRQFIRLSDAELTALGNTDFDVMVVANLPGNGSVPATKSRTAIEATALSTSFADSTPQPSFVMKGSATAVKSGNDYNATASMRRIAAKFSIAVSFPDTQVTGDLGGSSGPWTPDPSGITVKFYKAQSNGILSGTPASPATECNYAAEGIALSTSAFYSYPRQVSIEQRPFFVIKVPVSNGSVSKDCYYKLILDGNAYASNVWYRLNAGIKQVGSDKEPEPLVLSEGEYSYEIADWKGVDEYDSVIREVRYLMTFADSYVMENVDTISIPFVSSHDCVVSLTSATYTDFSGADAKTGQNAIDYANNKGRTPAKVSLATEGQAVILKFKLDNDWLSTNQNYDVSPFEYTIHLSHKSEPSYYKDIHVTQNPAVVIQAEKNNADYGNRFVNGKDRNHVAENLGGDVGDGVQTLNHFIIRISALPEGSEYVIGDPRDFSDGRWRFSCTNPTLQNGLDIRTGVTRNTLDNYYPTRDDGTADNMIAPVIRTSTAWGRLSSYNHDYEETKNRAATYQEGGYPAGRWRLLTQAEAKILAKLNHDKKIPLLFSDTHNFFVAGGWIKGQTVTKGSDYRNGNLYDSSNNRVGGSTRICYDEWYWSKSNYAKCTDPTKFTWGDMPREEFE